MRKGSNSSGNSSSKPVATAGYAVISPAPVATTGYAVISPAPVATTGYAVVSPVPVSSGGGRGSYQNTSRVSYGDKQTGSYGRATTTEKASAGDFYWKNGTTGTRSEYTQSSTVRVGDKSGYTEVYNEQRVRNVRYNNSGSSSNNVVSYGNDVAGGPYSRNCEYAISAFVPFSNDCDSDFDSDSDW